jgi:hypothetical protein
MDRWNFSFDGEKGYAVAKEERHKLLNQILHDGRCWNRFVLIFQFSFIVFHLFWKMILVCFGESWYRDNWHQCLSEEFVTLLGQEPGSILILSSTFVLYLHWCNLFLLWSYIAIDSLGCDTSHFSRGSRLETNQRYLSAELLGKLFTICLFATQAQSLLMVKKSCLQSFPYQSFRVHLLSPRLLRDPRSLFSLRS